MIENADTVLYTIAFLVPGFIWYKAASMFAVYGSQSKLSITMRYLIYSLTNYCIWIWMIRLINAPGYSEKHPVLSVIIWIVIVFVSPALFGTVNGIIRQHGLLQRALSRSGIHTLEASPTAWDFFFNDVSLIAGGTWIVVTLKDGKQVFGLFGPHSTASTEISARDIYLEKVVGIEPEFTPDDTYSIGIYIPAEQIAYIQIRRLKDA